MHPSKVNVPVALNVFVRPSELQIVFDAVKKARPNILFLIGDGPREDSPTDEANIKQCRKIVEDIDWDCQVYRIYSDKNKGMYRTYFDAQDYIFNIVDRCIFLEDDVLVSQSFFRFCEEMLERYKDDLRVHYVTGLNYFGEYDDPDADYFFCGEGSIWGYAIWKRTYESQNMKYANSPYVIDRMCLAAKQLKPRYEKKIRGYVNNPHYEGHIPGPEFFKNSLRFSQNQVYIVPTKNMVSNIGVGNGATHSADSMRKLPKGVQRLFNMPIYEYQFPLKHPQFVVRDLYYEKYVNRILGWNHPFVQLHRKISSAMRNLFYGDFSSIRNKIGRVLKRNIET
ncbi:hypothetical protein ABES03_02545 [Neobacillus rhizosphaerae]|uniref:hypothetical protein n=1 Tax=Neobacillus rhizosphaerae TaxID=2880965 RepID=UPI003D2943DA